jgi:hypothetical protein
LDASSLSVILVVSATVSRRRVQRICQLVMILGWDIWGYLKGKSDLDRRSVRREL